MKKLTLIPLLALLSMVGCKTKNPVKKQGDIIFLTISSGKDTATCDWKDSTTGWDTVFSMAMRYVDVSSIKPDSSLNQFENIPNSIVIGVIHHHKRKHSDPVLIIGDTCTMINTDRLIGYMDTTNRFDSLINLFFHPDSNGAKMIFNLIDSSLKQQQ